jgi:hypothetical protein
MKLKIVLGFLLLVANVQSVFSQVHLGATSAYNATFVLDKGLSEDPRYNSTMTYNWSPVGIAFGVDITPGFGLQLESILSKQGQIYDVINTAKEISGSRQINLEYLNLPLLMKFMSKGTGNVRTNFNIGPQMSILRAGVESLTTNAGDYEIPEGIDFATIKEDYPSAIDNENGTYTIPEDIPSRDILTKAANDFKNTEFQLAASFGLDFDIARNIFLTTQVRANYSFTDMRGEDVLNSLKAGEYSELFGNRANVMIGVQFGLHYYFGTLRSFREK